MKRKEFIDALQYLDIKPEAEERIIQNCQERGHKINFSIAPRKVATVVIILSIMSFSATVFAFATGLIKINLAGGNFVENTNYEVELQKNVISLDREIEEEIVHLYNDVAQQKDGDKTFDSFSEAGDFLGINLLDNVLFQNIQDAVSIEVYGYKNQPNRVKVVSYQTIEGYPDLFPVSAEFAIDASGNSSRILASSFGINKKTRFRTYHSEINDLTAQIIVIYDQDTQSYDVEVYFIQDEVLYNFTMLGDTNLSIGAVVKVVQNVIDGFVF